MLFRSSLTFGDGASFTADLNGDDASPGTDSVTLAQDAEISLPADSEGTVTITTSSTLALQPGSAIQTGLGNITLEAQQAISEGARLVSEAGALSLTAEDVELRSTEVDGSSIAMVSTTLLLENSNIQALGGDVVIESASLTLAGNLGTEIATTGSGSVSLTGDLVLAANSSVSVENGTLVVAGDAVSLEGQLVSAGTGSVSVTGETSLDLASTRLVLPVNPGNRIETLSWLTP